MNFGTFCGAWGKYDGVCERFFAQIAWIFTDVEKMRPEVKVWKGRGEKYAPV